MARIPTEIQQQAASFLSFGPQQAASALEPSGIELVQGIAGVESFLGSLQNHAQARIGNLLSEVRGAAWRSFSKFLAMQQAQLANITTPLERGKQKLREELQGRINEAGGIGNGLMQKAKQKGLIPEPQGEEEEQGTIVGENGYLGRDPANKPSGLVEMVIGFGEVCQIRSAESNTAAIVDVPIPEYVCICPDGSWLKPGERCGELEIAPSDDPTAVTTEEPPTILRTSSPFPPFTPTPTQPFPPVSSPQTSMLDSGYFAQPPQPQAQFASPPQQPTITQAGQLACAYPPPQPPTNTNGNFTEWISSIISAFKLPDDPRITQTAFKCGQELEYTISSVPKGTKPSVFFKMRAADGSIIVPPAIENLGLLPASLYKVLFGSIADLADYFYAPVEEEEAKRSAALGREAGCGLVRVLLGIAERWVSSEINDIILPYRQCSRIETQSDTPSLEQALSCYIAGTISRDEYECWVKFQNQKVDAADKIVAAQKQHFTPAELIALYRRESIDDGDVDVELRRGGWMETSDRTHLETLSQFVPPIQDIIRFMVRDADDPNVIARFGLDEAFEEKFGKELAKYSRWQNIPTEVARLYWRAHWRIPSFTQLAEIFHRNRKRGIPIESDPLYEDIKAALIQDDILPKWIPGLLSTTFTLPRQVDLKRMHFLGLLNKEQVADQFAKRGFNDDDAKALSDFIAVEKGRKAESEAATKEYQNGFTGFTQAGERLLSAGYTDAEAAEALGKAFRKREAAMRKRCVAAMRRRFAKGLADENEIHAEMIELTGDVDLANTLVAELRCEAKHVGKEIPASSLCRLFERGIITDQDYLDRLQKIGYDAIRAFEMLRDCQRTIDDKRLKELERLAKRQAAAAAKQDKDIEKEQQRRKRLADQLAKGREKQAKARQDMAELRLDISSRLAKKTGIDYRDMLPQVESIIAKSVAVSTLPEHAVLVVIDEWVDSLPSKYLGDLAVDIPSVVLSAQQVASLSNL